MIKNIYSKGYLEEAEKRFQITINFVKSKIPSGSKILDLGIKNPLAELMLKEGYDVKNTAEDVDLDFDYNVVTVEDFEVVTAFEILEHLVSPFPLLLNCKAKYLFASIPLKLWFSNAYWSESDHFDRHYHEFEPRQFDMLLDKAGWEIHDSIKWTHPTGKIGIRPVLRYFYPRYYLVFCERKSNLII